MKQHIPNGLTLSRGLLTLTIIILFFIEVLPGKFFIILFLFFLASFTDLLDGYLARKWQVISDFGIVFDSLFDKILTISVLALLIPYNVIALEVIIGLIVRDLFVDGLKNMSLSKGKPIPSIQSGKWKFVFQVLLIHFALGSLALPEVEWLLTATAIFGLLALVFAYYSGAVYTIRFFSDLRR